MNDPVAQRSTVPRLPKARIKTQLLTFFGAAFVIAWAAWIPLFWNPSLPRQIAFIGLFAPALAALSTAALSGGMRGVRDIIRRLTVLSFPLHWVVVSMLIMPAIYMTALGLLMAFGVGGAGPLFAGNSPFFIAAAFVWLLFVNSGEEIGWRAYALPLLLEQFDHPILVGLGLGVIWGVWHLPMYLLPGQSAFPFPLFLMFTSLQSVLYTEMFLRSKGSVLPALLLHAGTDIAPRLFQVAHLHWGFWLVVDLLLGAVVMALSRRLPHNGSSIRQF